MRPPAAVPFATAARAILLILSAWLLGAGESPAPAVTVGDPTRPGDLAAAVAAAYAQGARDITIAPGEYLLPASGTSAFRLDRWEQAVIHATGATLTFAELRQTPVRLVACTGVTWDGGTLRYIRPAATQGRITARTTDADGEHLDWRIDAGYPTGLDPLKATFDVVDPATGELRPGTGDLGAKAADELAPGHLRLRRLHGLVGAAQVGDVLFTRMKDGGNSLFHLERSARCTVRGVTLQNAGFAAIFETRGDGGHRYADCRFMPGPRPPGASEDQLVACGADGFHSSGVRDGPVIERCTWRGVLHDDCIAIHGHFQEVVRGEGRLLVLAKGDAAGFAAGEPVRISSAQGFFAEALCTGLRTRAQEGGLRELTLDRELAVPLPAKAGNPRRNGAGFRIIDCVLGGARSRGILVKADNGLIQGCTITGCGMSAISIGPEYWWNEADYCQRVVVRGNRLVGNVRNGSEAGAVFIHGDGAIGNRDLTIDDNEIVDTVGSVAFHAEDTAGLTITGNRFRSSAAPLPGGKARTAISLRRATGIRLRDNRVTAPAGEPLVTVGSGVEDLLGDDPAGIRRE